MDENGSFRGSVAYHRENKAEQNKKTVLRQGSCISSFAPSRHPDLILSVRWSGTISDMYLIIILKGSLHFEIHRRQLEDSL